MDNVVYADCVLINGKVATVDAHFSFKRAIAVKQGWIINVGEDQEIQQHIGPQTQVIDLGGKLILPAAHDSHIHIGWLADSWHCLNCQDVRSRQYCGKDCATRQPAPRRGMDSCLRSGSKRNQGVRGRAALSDALGY
nr:hypothetical protein [Klebsiella pneumoniae subsp. pneumoniae]